MASRGPTQVLLPYAVKNTLHAGAAAFGFILAAVGVGAVAASLLAGRLQMPRREVAVMCAVWAASFLAYDASESTRAGMLLDRHFGESVRRQLYTYPRYL